MNEIIKEISLIGIVPVITIEDPSAAVPLADALCAGGIPCAEIAFRTAAAKEAIAAIAKERPDILVGAGTVLTRAQVDDAMEAGADFIVTPGLNPEIVKYCTEKGITIIPGVNSPSGVEAAMGLGLDTVKFFPAKESGGVDMIKAMSAPYRGMKFLPTGGINSKNINEYIRIPSVCAVGGSWIASSELIAAGKFDEITALCRQAVDAMLNIRLWHVGVNCEGGDVMRDIAAKLERLMSLKQDVRGDAAIFTGTYLELLAGHGRGANGHIAFGVNSVDRGVYHLKRRGAKFIAESAGYNPDGSMQVIFFEDELAGFAYHLLKV